MKKIKDKPFPTFQFSEEEVENIKSEFHSNVDKWLSDRHTIELPMFTIDYLIRALAHEVLVFDLSMEQGMAIGSRDGMRAEAQERSLHIIEKELNGLGLEGSKIVGDIIKEEKSH